MKNPTNAIAETIQALEKQNTECVFQAAYYQGIVDRNNATIESLVSLATWEDVPDLVEENQILAP